MILASQVTLLESHDFSRDSEACVRAALRDVAQYGIAAVRSAIPQPEVDMLATLIEDDYSNLVLDTKNHQGKVTTIASTGLGGLIGAIRKATEKPDQIKVKYHHRIRNGTEGWHPDKTFDGLGGGGIRVLAQLTGPEASMVAVKSNSMIWGETNQPEPNSRFVAVTYPYDGAVLMAENETVTGENGVVKSLGMSVRTPGGEIARVSHPYHAGMQPDIGVDRILLLADVAFGPNNPLTDLGLAINQFRSSAEVG